MKKKITATITTLIAALTIFATGVYAGNYINWNGTQDYHQTLDNLDNINDGINNLQTDKQDLIAERDDLISEYEQLKTEKDETYRENEQLQNVIKDKENQIDSLEQQIEALEKRIEDGQTTRDGLEQAEKDMRDVQEKSSEVLEALNDE